MPDACWGAEPSAGSRGNWVVVETRSKAEPSGLPTPGSAVEQAGGSKLPLAKAQCDTEKPKC